MNGEQVFVWIMPLATQQLPKTIIFSAAGDDREQAGKKIVAYFSAVVPNIPALSPDLIAQWLKVTHPLIPEVKEGVWILGVDAAVVPSAG